MQTNFIHPKFSNFSNLINDKFNRMSEKQLYVTDVNIDALWQLYLDSFPEGTNEKYLVNRYYECSCCRNFIKSIGNVVNIKSNLELETVWDIDTDKLEYPFNIVVLKLVEFVKSSKIKTAFYRKTTEWKISTPFNYKLSDNSKFEHFYCEVPKSYRVDSVREHQGKIETNVSALELRLNKYSVENVNKVISLIDDGLYRGAEKRKITVDFKELLSKYKQLQTDQERNIFLWLNCKNTNIVNESALDTLFDDVKNGYSDDEVNERFYKIMDPLKYQRSSKVPGEFANKKAIEAIKKLGIESAIFRRYANIHDIHRGSVLFADRSIQSNMKGADELSQITNILDSFNTKKQKNFKHLKEVSIQEFIDTILPNVQKMWVLFEQSKVNNLLSLTSSKNDNETKLFKWDNNIAWMYKDGTSDSIAKQRVKSKGGTIDAKYCTRLTWETTCDLDLYTKEPDDNLIFYGCKCQNSKYLKLDIDANAPSAVKTNEPVENIYGNNLKHGWHKVYVNNYTKREQNTGFVVETEFNGVSTTYTYNKHLRTGDKINVIDYFYDSKKDEITEIKVYPSIEVSSGVNSKEIWGIKTNDFVPVEIMTISPNHWEKPIGNKHYIFILENCKNPDNVIGFLNEYLRNDLHEYRKSFELISDKTRCEYTDNQLSGLGFSETLKNTLTVKVEGCDFNEILNINFGK